MANIAKEEEGEKKEKSSGQTETRMREEGIKIKRRRF